MVRYVYYETWEGNLVTFTSTQNKVILTQISVTISKQLTKVS